MNILNKIPLISSLFNKPIAEKLINLPHPLNDYHEIRYSEIKSKIKKRVDKNKKVRVAFFVTIEGTFSSRPLFELMLKDELFEPFIVIVPELGRGERHMLSNYLSDYKSLSSQYEAVYNGYDIRSKQFIDYSDKVDMVSFARPYENFTHPFFEVDHYLNKDVLPFYIHYTFSVVKFSNEALKLKAYCYFWKIFTPTSMHFEEFKKKHPLGGKNVVVSGYCKMDDLVNEKVRKRKRKIIIISPHHTVINWKPLQISNFLKYADFFLELPLLYPQIDFIFRPHPLLKTQLYRDEIWGAKKTDEYFKKMTSLKNVKYSKGGEYLSLFANSDGIIHDCGSYLAEYLFTGKPACYLLKNKNSINKWFIKFGKRCLKFCYKAYSKTDIINFIEKVILNDIDEMKSRRNFFVNNTLKVNYPHVSEFIIEYIKNSFKNEE